ncbi:PucR family transcriptional regulator [Enterococcus faecalis]
MTIEKLQKLYPSGYLSKKAADKRYLSLAFADQYFIIKKSQLPLRECQLLEMVFAGQQTEYNHQTRLWYRYLFQQQPLSLQGSYRLLQIRLSYPADFLRKEWEAAVKEMFLHYADFFALSEREYLLVERHTSIHYSFSELEGVFLTLDSDFDLNSTVFVGSFYDTNQPIATIFREEQQLVQVGLTFLKGKRIFQLTDVALHYFTKEKLATSQITRSFSDILAYHEEIQPIIQALWQNQGNLSSAAKTLFMHRNTLHYRIDKFFEQTGFSLRKMEDLIFCYLLMDHK